MIHTGHFGNESSSLEEWTVITKFTVVSAF